MRIRVHGMTDMGRCRENNEDSFRVDTEHSLYLVADGVGGQPAGEVASRLATERLPQVLAELGEAEGKEDCALLERAVRRTNDLLLATAADRPAWKGMATTLVAAWSREDRLCIANVGDSRAYLVRGQQIELLSEDHTVLAEQERQGLGGEDAIGLSHVLTRCLGLEPEVEVYTRSLPVAAGDRLLLCSDGLNDSISDEVIRSVVLSSLSPAEGCRLLVELANRNGGRDNITVLLVYFDDATLKSKLSNLLGRRR